MSAKISKANKGKSSRQDESGNVGAIQTISEKVTTLINSRRDLAKFTHNAGLLFALQVRFWLEDIETVADTALTDGSNDKSCDLVYIDRTKGLVVIGQGYWTDKLDKQEAPASKATSLCGAVSWLLSSPDRELPATLRSSAVELRTLLLEDNIKTIEIWYAHNLPGSINVNRELRQVEETASAHLKAFPTKEPVKIRALEVDAEKLLEWYEATRNPIQVLDEINVEIESGYEVKSEKWTAYVTHVPASWLWKIFRDHGEKLFSANVRGYLGSRNFDANINNGIKTTASQLPSQFWVYNNGLTALVNEFTLGKKKKGVAKLVLSGLSIVNGAQTTGAIGALSQAPPSTATVQARFVKCVDDTIIDGVVQYNNSQNRVEASDFRSNDTIQKRLRDEFKSLSDVTYLGGRRGGTDDFIKRTSNLIPSDTAAQALCAFHGEPERAYNRKSELWKNDTFYSEIFNDSTTARHIIFAYSLLKAVQDYHQTLKNYARDNKLTEPMHKRLHFLSMRGATFLLMAAVSSAMEVVLGRKVSSKFRLCFSTKTSPKEGEAIWSSLLDKLIPFAPILSQGVDGGYKTGESLTAIVESFVAPIEAARDFLAVAFEDFGKQVEE